MCAQRSIAFRTGIVFMPYRLNPKRNAGSVANAGAAAAKSDRLVIPSVTRFFQHAHEFRHEERIVMPGASGDHVAIANTAVIDESCSADLHVELAFRNGRHTFT